MSTGANLSAFANSSSAAPDWERSACTPKARRPSFATSEQVCSGERELPWQTKSAPACARATAIAAPNPAEAPVTSAVLPSSLKLSRINRLLSARFQSRSRLAEFGLYVDHAELTILFLAVRGHGPEESDAMSGSGN